MRSALVLSAALVTLWVGPAESATAKIAWRDWNAGLKEAEQLQKPILVDVYTQWCGWCKRMDRDVYTRSDVQDYLRSKFVTVKLDAEAGDPAPYDGKTFTSRTLAAYFRINGYPTTVFLRSNGEHLVNVPGYVEPDKFMKLLRYVGDGHLERGVTWEEYSARSK